MNLKDKVIVITGGAQGLGLEMARMCADNGAALALIDMNAEQLVGAATELRASGVRVETYAANVSDEASVEQTFAAIAADFGSIDSLINNAGILCDYLHL